MKKIYTIILLSLTVTMAKATVHTVQVLSGSFNPSTVNAVCGDTVAWVLVSGAHTTTSTGIPSCATSWDAPINPNNPAFAIQIPNCAGTYNYVCTPHGFTGVIIVTCSVGIDEAANENFPTISPNPSVDGIFNLTFSKNENMEKRVYVVTTDGKKITDENISSLATNHVINLQSYAEGIYFLVMEGTKERRVMKLVR